jgi:orotidine-5'-phosphate decarboxylase
MPTPAGNRIIVALDVKSPSTALALVKDLREEVGGFKVGLEFITALFVRLMTGDPDDAQREFEEARELFRLIGDALFWDGKWHDIPSTLKRATEALIGGRPPRYFNVHASSGTAAIEAAAAAKGTSKLLVVTVLTSLDESAVDHIYGDSSERMVLQFASDALVAGADGVICSPQELELLGKQEELDGLLKVTPGVRPEWAEVNDQKRVMTPAEAIRAGADYLVIGRPITQPPANIGTPAEAARRIAEEIASAL